MLEAYRLGLGDPVPVSAAHGEGLDGLYEALLPYAEKAGAFAEDDVDADATTSEFADAETDDEAAEKPICVAIVGRPNVGKSTLVNRLLGEERMLTGPEAGITRDAIATAWRHRGQPMVLVDTAGYLRSGPGSAGAFTGRRDDDVHRRNAGQQDPRVAGRAESERNIGHVHMLSEPSLIATDSIPAAINVGTQVPVLTSQVGTPLQLGGTNAFTQNISGVNTGITLEVNARINPSGMVTLVVNQEVSSPSSGGSSGDLQHLQHTDPFLLAADRTNPGAGA